MAVRRRRRWQLLRSVSASSPTLLLNGAVRLQNIRVQPAGRPGAAAQAQGNPATVLLTPLAPLEPGVYRVTLHGGSADALTSVTGATLAADYSFTFTVEMP